MKIHFHKFYKALIVLTFFFIDINCSIAQPGGHGHCPKPPCPPPVPITGIEILIAGGVALGVRKLFGKKSIN